MTVPNVPQLNHVEHIDQQRESEACPQGASSDNFPNDVANSSGARLSETYSITLFEPFYHEGEVFFSLSLSRYWEETKNLPTIMLLWHLPMGDGRGFVAD